MATSKRSTTPVEETIDTTEEVQFVDGATTDETIVIENTTATATVTDSDTSVTTDNLLDETGALTTRAWHK